MFRYSPTGRSTPRSHCAGPIGSHYLVLSIELPCDCIKARRPLKNVQEWYIVISSAVFSFLFTSLLRSGIDNRSVQTAFGGERPRRALYHLQHYSVHAMRTLNDTSIYAVLALGLVGVSDSAGPNKTRNISQK